MRTMRTAIGFVAGLGLCHGALADVHYVSQAGRAIHPYTTVDTAARDIQAAVDAAKDGDEVVLDGGMYFTFDEIYIDRDITVRHGEHGKGAPNAAIVSGLGNQRVFYLDGRGGATPTVKGLSIINGVSRDAGGGVFIDAAGVLEECIVMNNRSLDGDGGGVHLQDGGRVERCMIAGNTALQGGGVSSTYGGSIDTCYVLMNGAERQGGGLYSGGEMRGNLVILNLAEDVRCADVARNASKRAQSATARQEAVTTESLMASMQEGAEGAGDSIGESDGEQGGSTDHVDGQGTYNPIYGSGRGCFPTTSSTAFIGVWSWLKSLFSSEDTAPEEASPIEEFNEDDPEAGYYKDDTFTYYYDGESWWLQGENTDYVTGETTPSGEFIAVGAPDAVNSGAHSDVEVNENFNSGFDSGSFGDRGWQPFSGNVGDHPAWGFESPDLLNSALTDYMRDRALSSTIDPRVRDAIQNAVQNDRFSNPNHIQTDRPDPYANPNHVPDPQDEETPGFDSGEGLGARTFEVMDELFGSAGEIAAGEGSDGSAGFDYTGLPGGNGGFNWDMTHPVQVAEQYWAERARRTRNVLYNHLRPTWIADDLFFVASIGSLTYEQQKHLLDVVRKKITDPRAQIDRCDLIENLCNEKLKILRQELDDISKRPLTKHSIDWNLGRRIDLSKDIAFYEHILLENLKMRLGTLKP